MQDIRSRLRTIRCVVKLVSCVCYAREAFPVQCNIWGLLSGVMYFIRCEAEIASCVRARVFCEAELLANHTIAELFKDKYSSILQEKYGTDMPILVPQTLCYLGERLAPFGDNAQE